MSSKLFKKFLKKRGIAFSKQAPPGPPPRRGLVWKPSTHRWIRPIDAVHQEIKEDLIDPQHEEVADYLNEEGFDDITPEEVQEAYDSVADQFDDDEFTGTYFDDQKEYFTGISKPTERDDPRWKGPYWTEERRKAEADKKQAATQTDSKFDDDGDDEPNWFRR